jgi:two-component system, OmpR family, KDP operon response regulator KdpE
VTARISLALSHSAVMVGPSGGRLALGEIVVDFIARQVARSERSVRLTPKEFNLLAYLAAHANQVLSDRELLQAAWGPEYGTEYGRLRVVVRQLRQKIEVQPSNPMFLVTVPCVGYQLSLPAAK